MELREVIRRRRMVRRFDPRPLPGEVLDRILHSATRAPSAGFSQGLDLLVLEGPEAVGGFWRATIDPGFGKPYSSAEPPVIVLVLSDKQAYLDRYAAPDKAGLGMDVEEGWPVPYWDMDAAMGVMLMLLTAVDEGVGAWWFGVFHGAEALLRDLGVPPGRRLVGAVALGFPAADDRPSGSPRTRPRRPVDEVVHRGRWGN
jgi:nitroreductase